MPGPPAPSATNYGLPSDGGESRAKGHEDLKLGPAPVDPKLEREVSRLVKDDVVAAPVVAAVGGVASTSTVPIAIDFADADPKAAPLPSLISPQTNETLPYPSTLRTIDVAREVEKVREGRKRIKLGAEAFNAVAGAEPIVGGAAKPSACLFTLHDTGDRSVASLYASDDVNERLILLGLSTV